MQIKTLAEIIAEQQSKQSADSKPQASRNNKQKHTASHANVQNTTKQSNSNSNSKNSQPAEHKKSKLPRKTAKKQKNFHPAANYQPKTTVDTSYAEPDAQTIKSILQQVRNEHSHQNETEKSATQSADEASSCIKDLPTALQAYLKTPEQRAAEIEQIKADSRLRWLAFYYLSRREHSAAELKQKLLNKDQDPEKIDALLAEFAEKGYQSEKRTALMLIREGIRKRRGRSRIKQEFYQRQIAIPCNIDELIDMANAESDAFADVVAEDDLIDGIDWLKLAVEARVKKYGEGIPNTPKEKARQLRFLQYRGFQTDICFEAIKYNLSTLTQRF